MLRLKITILFFKFSWSSEIRDEVFICLVIISGLYQKKNSVIITAVKRINSKVLNKYIKILLDLEVFDDLFLTMFIFLCKKLLLFYYEG